MHELSITENILRIALAQAQAHQAHRVKAVRLKVGEWSAVVPDCVEFYFALIAQGTIAEQARLEIEVVPLRARCRKCHHEFDPKTASFACPQCGSSEIALESGRELEVESIEVE